MEVSDAASYETGTKREEEGFPSSLTAMKSFVRTVLAMGASTRMPLAAESEEPVWPFDAVEAAGGAGELHTPSRLSIARRTRSGAHDSWARPGGGTAASGVAAG
jgi:hypothetical protein